MSNELIKSVDALGSHERFPFSASVGLLLEYKGFPNDHGYAKEIVLVSQKDTGKIGLIAGGVEKSEDGIKAVFRELQEEANFTRESIEISYYPKVIIIPGENKSSMGLVYEAALIVPIDPEGFTPDSNEISLVKRYSVDELLKLIENPDVWYRPEFNLKIVKGWLRGYVGIKYGTWEGPEFEEVIIKAWGLEDE